MITLEGSRNNHKIGITYNRFCICFELPIFNNLFEQFLHARLDNVQLSCVGFFHYFGVDINTVNLDAVLSGDDSGWESNISQAHKTCFHKKYISLSYLMASLNVSYKSDSCASQEIIFSTPTSRDL